MKFVRVLKASEDWKVEKISENDWVIKSPDGTYKNSNGKDYHFKTKEDALEELDYLRAEHKGDEKAKEVKSAYGYDTFEEVLEMQIKYLKSIKSNIDNYLKLSEETMKEIEQGNVENNLGKYEMLAQVEYLQKLVKIDDEVSNEIFVD